MVQDIDNAFDMTKKKFGDDIVSACQEGNLNEMEKGVKEEKREGSR